MTLSLSLDTPASMILTEIQNGLVSKVKQEQINLKKKAKHELKDIDELDRLNEELLNSNDTADTNKLEETKELYNSKYHSYFKKEAEKISIFRHINVKKPPKCFLNLTSDKMSQESPSID